MCNEGESYSAKDPKIDAVMLFCHLEKNKDNN